jgi:hypothetical protein
MRQGQREVGSAYIQFQCQEDDLAVLVPNPEGGMIAFIWTTDPEVDGRLVKYDPTVPEWSEFGAGGGGSGTVESVTGDGVDNTDPDNPVISFPTPADIGAEEVVNKATDFSTVNNTLYPSVQAVKNYVDTLSAGLKWKTSVKVATTVTGTLASSFENGDTVDGISLVTGDRILIKDQASGTENGIYIVNASGAPTRATDADSETELVSASVFVEQGTANADKAFVCTNDAITLGVTNINFVAFLTVLGALIASNDLSDLTNVSTARTNLGGTTVGQNIFTGADPSAVRYIRINADNTITFRSASEIITDLGLTTDGWVTDSNTWTFKNRTQAYTNDPAAGQSITLNMINTADFLVGSDVTVSSSAGSEHTTILSVVANTSITVNQLILNHTTTSRLVTLLDVFEINADVTADIKKGTYLKFTQTTVKYGIVQSSTFGSGVTKIVMIHNTDYALVNAAISSTYYSNIVYPSGWPIFFNYDPEPLGWSTYPVTDISYKYYTVGAVMTVIISQSSDGGVSNATTLTFSAPVTITNVVGVAHSTTVDNSSILTTAARTVVTAISSRSLTSRTNMTTGAWTASGAKRVVFMLSNLQWD